MEQGTTYSPPPPLYPIPVLEGLFLKLPTSLRIQPGPLLGL